MIQTNGTRAVKLLAVTLIATVDAEGGAEAKFKASMEIPLDGIDAMSGFTEEEVEAVNRLVQGSNAEAEKGTAHSYGLVIKRSFPVYRHVLKRGNSMVDFTGEAVGRAQVKVVDGKPVLLIKVEGQAKVEQLSKLGRMVRIDGVTVEMSNLQLELLETARQAV